ncbi:hypothetical protein [Bradyrhizobium sp. USDA 4512]
MSAVLVLLAVLAAVWAMALQLAPARMLAASAAANFAERFDIRVPGISFLTQTLEIPISAKSWVAMRRKSGTGRA